MTDQELAELVRNNPADLLVDGGVADEFISSVRSPCAPPFAPGEVSYGGVLIAMADDPQGELLDYHIKLKTPDELYHLLADNDNRILRAGVIIGYLLARAPFVLSAKPKR